VWRFLRIHRRRRLKALLYGAAAGISLVAGVSLWRGIYRNPYPQPLAIHVRKRTVVAVTEEKRKVYPYSLVAGGAGSVEEAKRLMRDPAVRAQYAAFDVTRLRKIILTSDLVGYVSYRYGDKIYWTAKKLRLKAGETVFTDGQHIARGRCLNCYSAYPMMPIRHEEPSESTMNTPLEVPMISLAFPNLPDVAPVLSPLVGVPPAPAPQPGGPRPGPVVAGVPPGAGHPGHPIGAGLIPLLPVLPIVPLIPPLIHRRHGPTSATVVNPPTPPSPPVGVVPEPDYRWICLAAVLAMVLLKRRRCATHSPPL
jgi:hypothetical protein